MQWENFPWQRSLFHFARAIGSLHLNEIESAEEELNTLKELRQEILNEGNQFNAKQVMIQINLAQGGLFFLKGQQQEGIALIEEAVAMEDVVGVHGITPGKLIPAREFLADMLLSMDKYEEALIAYEKNLKDNPNRFNGIYGAAIAAKQTGNQEKGALYFEKLLKITENTETDRPEVLAAKPFSEQN